MPKAKSVFIILFGVSGAGKTTVGEILAQELGWPFYDADNFHSVLSIEKMRGGISLQDTDRKSWLDRLRALVESSVANGESGVLACSALKENYRQYLCVDEAVKFVYLKGDFYLIEERLRKRKGHYMNRTLLQSQFDSLEEPKDGLVVDVTPQPAVIVEEIRQRLGI